MSPNRVPALVIALAAASALGLGSPAPASAATSVVAMDGFTRTASSSLGTADTGGAWTLAGPATRFAVGSGAGRVTTPAGVQLSAYLNTVSAADVDATATLSLPVLPVGGSEYHGLVVRRTASSEYTGRIVVAPSGAVSVNLLAGGTSLRSVAVAGLTAPAGTAIRLRVQAMGANPTTLRARAWRAGTAEPGGWQASLTDATAGLQGAGAVGVRSYLSSSVTNGPITAVVDDLSATASLPNQPPTAAITVQPRGLAVAVDGTASTDPDGTVTGFGWDFGDGGTATGATANHTYAAGGTYTVTLTIADDAGASVSTSRSVTVQPPAGPSPPAAVIAATPSGLHVDVDGSGSSDADGTVVGWAWDFGDGGTASGSAAAHDYAASGTFTVTLVVTDDSGATGTATTQVTVARPNSPPVAAFAASASGRTVALDASASSDADGPIAAFAWDFGDGTTGAGATTTHAYAADGTVTITLTVTDGGGATGRSTQQLTVSAPPSPVIAQDAFGRSVTNGLGTADVGGTWTLVGTASRFQVTGGAAQLSTVAGGQLSGYLGSATATDVDATAAITLPALPVGGSVYAGLVLRHTATTDYGARLVVAASGAVTANLMAGATSLRSTPISGLTASAGTPLRLRAQATGASPTTLRLRVWRADQPEPSTWAVSLTDTTAGLQGPGSAGLRTYVSSGVTNGPLVTGIDDLSVSTTGPVNTAPSATFTATAPGSAVSVDGSASTDAEGPIAAFAWTFGDGGTATGATALHTYATSGSYTVALTVTDGGGATASATRTVVIDASRPSRAQWLADVDTAMTGGQAYLDAQASATRPAIVLDIDNTALESYYSPFDPTPPVLALEQRAVADGYAILFATGRSADTGGTLRQLTAAGYRVDALCFRDPGATNVQASKVACRAGWVAAGYTIVADVGNHTSDLDGGNAGKQYLLPDYGFLD